MDASPDQAEKWGGSDGTVAVLPSASPHNLPQPLTSFVGRERELAELRQQLESTRLLTLTGAGGCGKTRLAIQAASEVLERFPDGAWWVELAPLGNGELLGAAIAEALDVRPLPRMTPLQAAGAYLASRRALVILDNCEHLLGACAEAAEALLQVAPNMVVMATSRAPLGVGGETEWRVPSLSLPGSDSETSQTLAGSDAARLFLERGRQAQPDFALSEETAGAVVEICNRLDGMPLAIELAAARLRMLSPEQISTGVSDRFRLLTGGPRTATPRLQTLRASVDWSHDLLSNDEQVLLRGLAVFAGGFTLEAVEEVCAGDGIERDQVLDLLASLVDQSLAIAGADGRGVRYRLLETMRQYGLERLAAAGEETALRDRHRDAFLALAEQAGPHLETAQQHEWLEALDPEAANLAAAIDHAVGSDPPLAVRCCAALYRWWSARGHLAEAELAHSRALDACGDREPGLRARAFYGRTYIAIQAGDYEAAEAHGTEALALADQVGDEGTAARARMALGGAMMFANPPAARKELGRAAELARAAGDDWALVSTNNLIAYSYMLQSDHLRAARANDEVAELAERQGDPFQVAQRWSNVGWAAILDGPLVKAGDAIERIRLAVEGVGEPLMATGADFFASFVDLWSGEPERALECLQGQLESAVRLGVGLLVPNVLAGMAFAELALDRPDEARSRLEGLLPIVQGRESYVTSWALWMLADAQRLLADEGAESTAIQARATGEQSGNRLWATRARLTLGRLAAERGEWTDAQQHALAHLDVSADEGHALFIPACLDALSEVAAGLERHEDGVRMFAAAERARNETGVVRIPPEQEHWAAIEAKLHDALGNEAYETARRQGAELSVEGALEWARRARGPRGRPPGGWASLTPTELRVVELVAEGLTNPQIAERMFISPGTVKTHVAHVFRKVDVHSRAELSAQAAKRRDAAS